MGLRIKTNIPAQETMKNLRLTAASEAEEFAKQSSGKRITKAADDAAGMAMSTNLKAQVKGLKQATRNANDGIALVQVAEGGLNETSNILTRLRELSIQAASDTLGENERGYLNQEFSQLVSEVDRISNSTTFAGATLINGQSERGLMEFHVGAFAGDENKIVFDSQSTDARSATLGISGVGVSSKGEANDAIASVDSAIEKISNYRANLGSIQSRLQSTVSNLEVQTLNQDSARSQIEDLDYAESTAKMASLNVIKSAGMSTLAQANNIPMSAMKLVG